MFFLASLSTLRIQGGGLNDCLNPLTTDDTLWHYQILPTCYLLVQFVLKIGSVLAERVGQGEVGGCTTLADSAWWQL